MTYFFIAIITLLIDIFTKIAAVKLLTPLNCVEVIEGILNLTYVENRGIAFGMFEGQRLLFVVASVLILAVVVTIIYKTPPRERSFFLKLGGALVVSGAIGNLIDRIVKGYVVDFIEFGFIDFPVFNIADIAVCVGAVLLVIHFLFFDGKKNDSAEEKDND